MRRALVVLGSGVILTLLTLVSSVVSTIHLDGMFVVAGARTANVVPTGDFVAFLPLIACRSASPQVHSIHPSSASTAQGTVGVTIVGENFRGVPYVLLTRVGFADILGTGVNVTAGTRINCSFHIADADPGVWDVVVVNPDGSIGQRSNAFTITAPPTPTATESPQIAYIYIFATPASAPVGAVITVHVLVRDQYGNPMSDQTVEFSIVLGPGSVDPETTQTDGYGEAQTELVSSEAGLVRVRGHVGGISNSIEAEFFELLEESG